MAAVVHTEQLASLTGFRGALLRPGDEGFEEMRRVHNGLVDIRPALIARCAGVADVQAAVAFARDGDYEISIRGGGHNVAGTALVEEGVTIDLSGMKGIHVDPAARTVRAQGGVTWGELNRETQLHGLAVTGGIISTTGIAGLTLGGGWGWLMPKYGLAIDNLLSAEVVTAAGEVVTASAEEHPDLFWALRGGGGNFGVVTSFEYRLHEVGPTVTGGLVVHPFDAAGDVLRFLREFSAGAPDELMLVGALVHAPDGSGLKVSGIAACHSGPPEQAADDLAELLAFGSPLDVQLGPMPYEAVNAMLDAAYPAGSLNYWKSTFLRELSDEAIDTAIERFATAPSAMTGIVIEHFHGAVARVPVTATASPHRGPGFNFLTTSVWLDPETTGENVVWTRDTYAAMAPFASGLRWQSYLDEDDRTADPIAAAFGPNAARLADVKAVYDPANLFHRNVNIRPAGMS
jgi:FAD/FMN-containing dehydrogenase